MNVRDLSRGASFFVEALGFAPAEAMRGAAREFDERSDLTSKLRLGETTLELASSAGELYPTPRAANDPWFQHFAIRVSDMERAFEHLERTAHEPISLGGPQQLPPSTGSVIAYKFRDPDGHPLELSWQPGASAPSAVTFVEIDHCARAVDDLEASVGFYVGALGFREHQRLLNEGPTQWRLDGLTGAHVDIVVLMPGNGGPHLELLHYRAPHSDQPPRRFGVADIAATRLVIEVDNVDAVLAQVSARPVQDRPIIADPDGHLIELVGRQGEA